MIDPLLELTLALPLALLFFLAARHKQAEGARFEAQLGAYAIMPEPVLPAVARLIPMVELAVALLLLLPVTRTFAALAAAVLLIGYALAMGINLMRGKHDLDCGCGGAPQSISIWLVLRNVLLAGAALVVVQPALPRTLGISDLLIVALMAVLLSAAYAMIGQLIANHSVLRTWSRDIG